MMMQIFLSFLLMTSATARPFFQIFQEVSPPQAQVLLGPGGTYLGDNTTCHDCTLVMEKAQSYVESPSGQQQLQSVCRMMDAPFNAFCAVGITELSKYVTPEFCKKPLGLCGGKNKKIKHDII